MLSTRCIEGAVLMLWWIRRRRQGPCHQTSSTSFIGQVRYLRYQTKNKKCHSPAIVWEHKEWRDGSHLGENTKCIGEEKTHSSWKVNGIPTDCGKKPWFEVFTDFCGINITTMADFKLVTWYHWIQSWEEVPALGHHLWVTIWAVDFIKSSDSVALVSRFTGIKNI